MPRKSKKHTNKAQEDFYASLVDSMKPSEVEIAKPPKASASVKPKFKDAPREEPHSKPLPSYVYALHEERHEPLADVTERSASAPPRITPTISTPPKSEVPDIAEPDLAALNIPFGFDLAVILERSDCNLMMYRKLLQEICPAGIHEELGAKILDLCTSKQDNYKYLFSALIDNRIKPDVAEYFLNNIGVFNPVDGHAE